MKGKTSFYLLTDTHFVSKKSWDEVSVDFTMRERGDQIVLKASPEILDAFIEKIIADKDTDTVVFTGDHVKNGDMNSHYDFRLRLEKLTAAGKKVYVVTATHDYCGAGDDENGFHSVIYTATGTEDAEFMRKSGLFDFYFDYGPKQALSVHRESGSYVVSLGEGVRLIMINDNGNGRSHCGLFEDGVKWLTEQIKEAGKEGDYVLLAVHHPVIPPFEVYRHMVEFEMYGGHRELQQLMRQENVKVVFTGHTHVQNIRKSTDEFGRWMLDISTIAAVNAAGKMRYVTVDTENGVCDVKSIGFEKLEGVDTKGKPLYNYLYELNLPGRIELLASLAKKDFNAFLTEAEGTLPVDKLKKFPFLTKAAFSVASNIKVSAVAKLGGAWKTMTKSERKQAENEKLLCVAFEVLRHIFPGNAPFTPDTVEYRSLNSLIRKLDKLIEKHPIEKIEKLIPPGYSLADMADDFLYNNRTGDDDSITFSLK